jgi:WD40 repeat protein
VATGQALAVSHADVGWITRVAFSPDGRWVVVGGSAGRAEVRGFYGDRVIQTFASGAGPILGVAFSPDGTRVATTANASGMGVVQVWDVSSGDQVLSFKVSGSLIERVTFSPDGRRLAVSGWDGTVRLADVATGHEVLALRAHSGRVWGVNFSPSGDALVSASEDGKVLLWSAPFPSRGPVKN